MRSFFNITLTYNDECLLLLLGGPATAGQTSTRTAIRRQERNEKVGESGRAGEANERGPHGSTSPSPMERKCHGHYSTARPGQKED